MIRDERRETGEIILLGFHWVTAPFEGLLWNDIVNPTPPFHGPLILVWLDKENGV